MTDPVDPVIHRYEVPVDGGWHDVELSVGAAVWHVAARRPDFVEFWAQHFRDHPSRVRRFRAYGTGEPVDGWGMAAYRGTAIVPGVALVWHLLEKVGDER